MLRSRDEQWPKRGYRIVRPRRVPAAYLRRQLEALASARQIAGMVDDVLAHGAASWQIAAVNRLSDTHPDRRVGDTTYTHTVRVLYKPSSRPGTWECIYGVTDKGDLHLWMD